jgi:hypothetical protein
VCAAFGGGPILIWYRLAILGGMLAVAALAVLYVNRLQQAGVGGAAQHGGLRGVGFAGGLALVLVLEVPIEIGDSIRKADPNPGAVPIVRSPVVVRASAQFI